MIEEVPAAFPDAFSDSLVFALPEGGDWQQVTFSAWRAFNGGECKPEPLPGLKGMVRFVLFIVREGHAVNAIPHYRLLDDNGFSIASKSLNEADAKRMDDLWWIELRDKREMTPEEQAEYNELGEKGYRNALPDRETMRQLIRMLPVPIDSAGGIRSFLALAGLDSAMFDRQPRTRVM